MPEAYDKAALRHYEDAERLAAAQRYDNAGHLIGFAVECAIKHAFALAEPSGDSPRLHLPDLAYRVLKLIRGRNPRSDSLQDLLERTRGRFFYSWRVSARYGDDGNVDRTTYEEWKTLAERTFGAAGLSRRPAIGRR